MPHLLGPVLARPLDRSPDARPLLVTCCAGYGCAVAAAALLVGHAPLALPLVLLVLDRRAHPEVEPAAVLR